MMFPKQEEPQDCAAAIAPPSHSALTFLVGVWEALI